MGKRFSRTSLAALILLCWAPAAIGWQAPETSERARVDAAARRTADRLRALQREADALAARERTLLVDLRKLEVDRQIAIEKLAAVERDLATTRKALLDAEARADQLARAAEAQLPDVEARLTQLYKMGRAGYWRLLLNVDDLQELGRAYRAASALHAIDLARVNEHYATLDALARERRTLHTRETELEGLQKQAAAARAALDKAVAARTSLINSIDARRDLAARLIGELQVAQQRLQASLAQIDAGKPAVTALPLRAFQGDLPWPARGTVTGGFGRQSSSRFGTAILRNGVEIGTAEGQQVRSVHEGTIAFADHFPGYGNLIIVDHGNRAYSLYGYLESLAGSQGQRVEAGTVVGTSGVNPSGNPALYFELRVDGTAVDPLQWLRK
jgi:septal ring factor EnvC (AmiA/AmiB activator)